jgi:molecular chaperone DnaK
MPRIQHAVKEFFGRDPAKSVHPDEAVAVGAAIQASALVEKNEDVLLLDVTPHSLGIMVHGGGFEKIIEANTTIPTNETEEFTTIRDNQTSIKIVVAQGESSRAEDNEMLGEFVLSGLRSAPAGEVTVDVTFDISADGIVSVSAKDQDTGKEQSITVTAASGLTEEEIQAMISENADYLVQLKEGEEVEKHRVAIRKTIRELENLMHEAGQDGTELVSRAREKAERAVSDARVALEDSDLELLASAEAALDRAFQAFRGVVSSR